MNGYVLVAFIIQIHVLSTTESKNYTECAPLPFFEVENGQILRLKEQRYTFTCNPGYFPNTNRIYKCYEGEWMNKVIPRCLRKEGLCDEPPEIENGIVLGDSYERGSSITYMCNEGYILLGKTTRMCAETGYWTGITPTCMEISEPIHHLGKRLRSTFVAEMDIYAENNLTSIEGRSINPASLAHGLELVLLIDRSSSIDPVHLENSKEFVKFLLNRFSVRNGASVKHGTRAAVFAFGSDVQLVFNVDNETITGPRAAGEAIDAIKPNGGGTNMEGALTHVIVHVSHILRPNAKRALFLMTDGEPNIANPQITPQDMAAELKSTHEFEIYTVGIGADVNTHLLSELASPPPLSHVFVLSEYPDLKEIMKVIEEDDEVAPIKEDQCGHVNKRGDRQWLAAVYIGGRSMWLCGGVLICKQWVLTAASCIHEGDQRIHKQNVYVTLGENHLITQEANQTNFYAIHVIIHPKYDPSIDLINDLALIKLDIPTSTYKPACLPSTDSVIPLHQNMNLDVAIFGWGANPSHGPTGITYGVINLRMNFSSAHLLEDNECPGKRPHSALLCASHVTNACFGNIGSPLIAPDPATGFHHVLGIQSGRLFCKDGKNQYVELTSYVKWINEVTGDCQSAHW